MNIEPQVVNLDELEFKYMNDGSDNLFPIIRKEMILSKNVIFKSNIFRRLPLNMFNGLGISDISFNFNVYCEFRGNSYKFDSISTTKGLNLSECELDSDVIKCKSMIIFSSKITFMELHCKNISLRLSNMNGEKYTSINEVELI